MICRHWAAKHTIESRTKATLHKLQLQNRISTPKRKNYDFEALLKRNLKGKSSAPKGRLPKTFATFVQPVQYDLWLQAAKDNSITHTAAAARNLDAAICHCDLQTQSCKNTIESTELRTAAAATQIEASKPDLDAKAKICSHYITIYDPQLQKTIVLRHTSALPVVATKKSLRKIMDRITPQDNFCQ